MNLSNTWKHYYQNLVSNKDANKNLQAYVNDSDFDSKNDVTTKILITLTQYKDTIILAKAPISNSLVMYHIVTNFGGSYARPDNTLAGLVGIGSNTTPIIFKTDSITKILEVNFPSNTSLKNIKIKNQSIQ